MHTKKQRIISFLMAFLLIFTFVFVNPLTISKSYAVAPVLTVAGQRIIAAVLVSSGIVIKGVDGLSDTQKQDMLEDFTNYVWWTMSLVEKATVLSLQIIDNVVNIPVSVYNMIKDKVQKNALPDIYNTSLELQGIVTNYSKIPAETYGYSEIFFPVYEKEFGTEATQFYTHKEYDMTEAEPVLVYEGLEGATSFSIDNVTTNIFDYGITEDNPIVGESTDNTLFIAPDLLPYEIPVYNNSYFAKSLKILQTVSTFPNLRIIFNDSANAKTGYLVNFDVSNYTTNNNGPIASDSNYFYSKIFKLYFVKNSSYESNVFGFILDVYDSFGTFLYQFVKPSYYTQSSGYSSYTIGPILNTNYSTTINSDMTFDVESNPAPVVTNTDATENVITLPSDLADSVGITSADVNVKTDTGTGTDTETLDNINTNVGELVTGGELGSEVNTNIEDVEGLHSEITDNVDFDSIFTTISQYISALDISSVTWFPIAVAGFISPFIPLISLGLILFFIDRILNGGA